MKKTFTALLALALLLLSACSSKAARAETEFAQIRERFAAASTVSVTASVTADYGERAFDFRVKFTGSGNGGEIEILAPEALAGVTARVADGGAGTLKYDGAELDTGSLGDGISPAAIIPRLVSEWRAGFADSLTEGKSDGADEIVMRSSLTADAYQTTRFDASTHLPVRAEVVSSGRVVLTVVFESVTLT